MESTLEDYELLDKIGEGSEGSVWRARHREDGREVAIKNVNTPMRTRSLQPTASVEAQVLLEMKSDRVVSLVEMRQDRDHTYLVMEYVRGRDLHTHLCVTDGLFDEHRALRVVEGVLEGLVDLHACGIAHRDLKLENIMLVDGDCTKVKLVDFGMAHQSTNPSKTSLCTTRCGSLEYMSPQVVSGAPYDPTKADLWCVGIVLHALIAGSLPFGGESRSQLFKAIKSDRVLLEDSAWSHVADSTKALVRMLLCKDPQRRQNASSCLKAVRDVMSGGTIVLEADEGKSTPIPGDAKEPRRRRGLFAGRGFRAPREPVAV